MNYLTEWQNSCVDEQLIRLNVTALEGSVPTDYLLYSDSLPRRNDGRVSQSLIKRYEHTEQGGWWCSGIDLLTGHDDLWGCFKPNTPRLGEQQKLIKYEHPPKTATGLFALRVPLHIWQMISERFGVPILSHEIAYEQPDFGFWQWLKNHPEIPLCITEGAKKAGALLTAGYPAIALPGIHNGYRVPKDDNGNRIGKAYLIPQLQQLATSRRTIYLVFDQDTKPNTITAVNTAIKRMGYLLTQIGCSVKVITWKAILGKGVDDFLANQGQSVFDETYQKALSFEIWQAQILNQLTYQADLEIHQRYVPNLVVSQTAKLIALKSPKGTGKTRFLENIVAQALANHQKVLVIGHRVKLVEELCYRFGLPYVTEVRDEHQQQLLGYGLCIDSLHPQSQAQFDATQWKDSLVIIDEVEQVLWHGLNSETCKNQRVSILKTLKTLIQNVLGSRGQVYLADADLSDISLDYFISLSGIPLKPFIIQNTWKPSQAEAYQFYNYPESTPKKFIKDLVKHIRDGGKPLICLSAQKLTSQWGTCNLESYFKKQFPTARILRIDSESLIEPNHPAYQCMTHLNNILKNYDIVLASPSIETGVSIDLKGHFTSVWCLAQGLQTVTSICQSLGRVRENIPRYVWFASYGFNQIGNGATSIPSLLSSGHRLVDLNIRLLQQSDLDALNDLDTGFQAESLLCWAKMAVRVNASMINYRENILAQLEYEGHQKIEVTQDIEKNPQKQNQLSEAINAVREQNYQEECQAIAKSPLLSDDEYRQSKKRLIKSISERRSLKKYDLQKRYGISVDAELVMKDDAGWYQKLRKHYFLTIGRQFLSDRDTLIAKKLLDCGHGSLFIPDFNGSQLGAIIGTMEVLGISVLLAHPERELRPTDLDLQKMAKIAIHNRSEIKSITKIGLAANSSPITIIRRLLDLLGYGLTQVRLEKIQKKSIRVYQITLPRDGREEVFRQWLFKDERCPGSSEIWYEDYLLALDSNHLPTLESPYVQLSLEL